MVELPCAAWDIACRGAFKLHLIPTRVLLPILARQCSESGHNGIIWIVHTTCRGADATRDRACLSDTRLRAPLEAGECSARAGVWKITDPQVLLALRLRTRRWCRCGRGTRVARARAVRDQLRAEVVASASVLHPVTASVVPNRILPDAIVFTTRTLGCRCGCGLPEACATCRGTLTPNTRSILGVVATVAEGLATARRWVASEWQARDALAVGATPSSLCNLLREVLVVCCVVELLGLLEVLHRVAVIGHIAGPGMVRCLMDQCCDAAVRIDVVEPIPAQVDEVVAVRIDTTLLDERTLRSRANWSACLAVALLVGDRLPDIADDPPTAGTSHGIICWVNIMDAIQKFAPDEIHGAKEPFTDGNFRQGAVASEPLLPEI
mmetsp:Transcript_89915/g.290439  ORF Transcript_89915/g.290439 Transcript_89915/m.290439 type:complete len:380 (+) Transcript_89915:404-1543(+)